MATAAARQHKAGDAVAYAAKLERWRQEVSWRRPAPYP